jgi:hypothetical protein
MIYEDIKAYDVDLLNHCVKRKVEDWPKPSLHW